MKGVTVTAGQSDTKAFEAYLGPKEDDRLLELPDRQDEIMEFGWMSWVSRPLLLFMNWINSWVGNYGWTIVILTIIIKTALWYPQTAANRSMKKMQLLAPMMKELQEKHKNDATKLNEEMLKLYQEYSVNPVGGCLPLLVQFPIFIGFYYMLSSAIEMRHASFLWVADLSQPDTIAHLPIPGLFDLPINPMPLIMTASMFWSMRITPQPQGVDNPAMHLIKFMPFLFLFFCYNFSSALSLYWTVQNLLSIGQLYYNLNQPDPVLEKKKKPAATKPAMNLFAPKTASSTAPKKRRKR